MTDLQARAEAAADMRQAAKELRENANGDCWAIEQALHWEGKAEALMPTPPEGEI